jgi:hypothetical protein
VTKNFVPDHKGKSELTDKTWAKQVYNARRMFITHAMAIWLTKHPAKKHDTLAKRVSHLFNLEHGNQ